MEYELKTLERLVLEILHPGKLKLENLNASFIGKYKRIAHIEKERIKIQFIQAGFEPGGEGRIELYIRQHQKGLVHLADAIYFYHHPKSNERGYRVIKDASLVKLYTEIYHCLDCLINFIETRFAKYFDPDAKIPEAYRWAIAPEMGNDVLFLKKAFKKIDVPDELIKIVCGPLEDYLLPDAIITCREFKYLKMLQSELILLAKKADKNNFTVEIESLLLQLNLNCTRFSNYFVEQLIETGRHFSNKNELMAFYSMKLKFINQVIVKPGYVYYPEQSSLCEQVGRWITEELCFLEKHQHFAQLPDNKPEPLSQKQKVHTSLSVAHLSLVVKLLVDAKIIKTKNSTALLKQVARCFTTDHSDDISEDSLRNKFYNFDASTIDQVKDVIKGLMGMVMKY